MVKKIRLQVALAQLGFASRRAAAGIIRSGRVRVNQQPVLEPGYRVDLVLDAITVAGRPGLIQNKVYYILNKPKGITSTVKDRFAQRTVLDLIKPLKQRIYPVGRLDKDTTGLIILTNDGTTAYRLTHPKFGLKRVYRAKVRGVPSRKKLMRLEKGVILEGVQTAPCRIELVGRQAKSAFLKIELKQGRKRQIKKMLALIGHPLLSLERTAFGPFELTGLKSGQWRRLSKTEIEELKGCLKAAAGSINKGKTGSADKSYFA